SSFMNRGVSPRSFLLPFTVLFFIVPVSFSAVLQSENTRVPQAQAQPKENDSVEANSGRRNINITDLLQEVSHNGASTFKQLSEYTYLLKKTRRILDKQGKVKEEHTQDFEAYPVSGEHALIQLARNGQPLPSWQIDADRRRAGERLVAEER